MEKKKILVIDDLEMNRLLLKSFLRQNGFDVDIASDGLEGLKMLDSNQYQCVFTDIEMPNMNGFEFLSKFKKRANTPDIPVVVLSSLKTDAEISKANQLGASYYMVKPFTVEKMKDALSVLKLNTL